MSDRLNELIAQLENLSPMLEDKHLSEQVLIEYERIVTEISNYKDPAVISPIVNSFGYGEGFGLFWTAMQFLETFEPKDLNAILLNAIVAGERGSRLWATRMLMRARNYDAIPKVVTLLDDPNAQIRVQALRALSVLDSTKIEDYISKLDEDSSPEVRSETIRIRKG
jgi:hypothetical protein